MGDRYNWCRARESERDNTAHTPARWTLRSGDPWYPLCVWWSGASLDHAELRWCREREERGADGGCGCEECAIASPAIAWAGLKGRGTMWPLAG